MHKGGLVSCELCERDSIGLDRHNTKSVDMKLTPFLELSVRVRVPNLRDPRPSTSF